jgi:hypothetical protein
MSTYHASRTSGPTERPVEGGCDLTSGHKVVGTEAIVARWLQPFVTPSVTSFVEVGFEDAPDIVYESGATVVIAVA